MAFQFSDNSPQYHPPVAPEVPAVRIEPQGERLGGSLINAFVHKAIADEQAQLQQKQLLQNADLQAKKLDYDYAQLDQEHALKSRALDIDADRAKHYNSHLDQLSETAKTQNQLYGTAFQRNLMFEKQKSSLMLKAGATADELKLTDPEFQTAHPMEYAKNAYAFEKKYGSTVDPQLKAAVTGFVSKAEESKVKLEGTSYPWSQIVKDIAVNEDNSTFIPMLQKAGYMNVVREGTTKTTTPKGMAKTMLESSKGVNFKDLSNVKPETSALTPKNATAAIASGALDMGVQPPPAQMSKAEVEANHVKQLDQTDPAGAARRHAIFMQRNPTSGDLLN